jgi:beta-phosphoglucomutase-like phosphatase (HAD superfamily)
VLKAVIFDFDGSVDLHARSWIKTFANVGVEAKLEDVRGHIGEGADRLIPTFVPVVTPKDPFMGVLSGDSHKRELKRSGASAIYYDPADLLAQWSRWRDWPAARHLISAHT